MREVLKNSLSLVQRRRKQKFFSLCHHTITMKRPSKKSEGVGAPLFDASKEENVAVVADRRKDGDGVM